MSAAPVEELEVEDLDASRVLEAAAEAEVAERRAALMKLRLAYQWATLHPATSETGIATHGGPALDVLTADESLGGDGTPAAAAFTPESFALRLGISPSAGAQLMATLSTCAIGSPCCGGEWPGCRCRPGRPAESPSRPTVSLCWVPVGSTNGSPLAPTEPSAR